MTQAQDTAQQRLQQRAQRLAAKPPQATQSDASRDYLVFKVGEQKMAIGLHYLRAMVPMAEIAWLRGRRPHHWLGMMNWHGELVPVLSPSILSTAAKAEGDASFLMLLETEHGLAALTVDELMTHLMLNDAEIEKGRVAGQKLVQAIVQEDIALVDFKKLAQRIDSAIAGEQGAEASS